MKANGEQKIKVLIIDSHEAVRRALHFRLSVSPKLDVVGAVASPEAAAPLIQDQQPAVILLGLQKASDDDLYLMAKAVYEMSQYSADVIVLVPYADTVEREMLLQAGASSYLLKHINSPKLIREIERVTVVHAT